MCVCVCVCVLGGGQYKYYVKWEGYPPSENTWEPQDHFVPAVITQYWNL